MKCKPGESKTFEEASDNRDHLAMMRHPEWWGHRPFLPLRKRIPDAKGFPYALGFLIEGTGPVVFSGCAFGVTVEGSKRLKQERFRTVEEIVAAGWEVD